MLQKSEIKKMVRPKSTPGKWEAHQHRHQPQQQQQPVRRPHRYRPGTVALREIRHYQKSTENLVPRAAIQRIIREVQFDILEKPLRWEVRAMEAIQVSFHIFSSSFRTKKITKNIYFFISFLFFFLFFVFVY